MSYPGKYLILAAALLIPPLAHAQGQPQAPGIDTSFIDKAVLPGNDFFHFADGAWVARTDIPADRSGLSVFATLSDRSSKNVASIIEGAARAHPAPNTDQRRVADLYAAYMDQGAIDARGIAPLKPMLAAVGSIHNAQDLAHALGETLRADVDALNHTNFHTANLFGLWVAPGFNDPDHYAPYLLSGRAANSPPAISISADSRSHEVDPHRVSGRTSQRMLTLAGYRQHRLTRRGTIVALEHSIAERHISLADSEDIEKANNTWKRVRVCHQRRRGSTGKASSRPPDSTEQPSLHRLAAHRRDRGGHAGGSLCRSRSGRITSHTTTIENNAGVLPKALRGGALQILLAPHSRALTQQRPRDQRAVAVVNASARRCSRANLRAALLPAGRPKHRLEALVQQPVGTAFRVRLEKA